MVQGINANNSADSKDKRTAGQLGAGTIKKTSTKKRKRSNKKKSKTVEKVVNTNAAVSKGELSANWINLCKKNIIEAKTKKIKSKVKKEKTILELAEEVGDNTSIKAHEVWFDGVDSILLDPMTQANMAAAVTTTTAAAASSSSLATAPGNQGNAVSMETVDDVMATDDNAIEDPAEKLVRQGATDILTHTIAMDCEMVGVGPDGSDSILARCSIVNQYGVCIYDVFVKPTETVSDYRTPVSGIRPKDLVHGVDFKQVQRKVAELMKGRLLVGHAIQHDLKVLFLTHPFKFIRDTSKYKPFKALFQGKTPSLKKLSDQVLGVKVQSGEHSSIQDAQATMRLYTFHKTKWEKACKNERIKTRKMKNKK